MKFVPCKKCGCMPQMVIIDDLIYIQCTGRVKKKKKLPNGEYEYYTTRCDKWGIYEFLSTSKQAAADNWNQANTTGRQYDDEI